MKTFRAAVLLVAYALSVTCHADGVLRSRRDLRYRQNVAYAYQYRTDQFSTAQKVPSVPIGSAHIQEQLLQQVKPTRRTLHFPTRHPMQAVDQLHTRVDIGQHRVLQRRMSGGAETTAPGIIVAHTHTEVYRKYR